MKRGFTLIEVMVAVAILGLSLTAIFSSQAGAIRMASRSGKMGMAALLVRCKMGEIEEQIADEGLPAIFASGSDGCCEDGELEGFSCDWEINPVVLPDSMFAPEDEEGLFSEEEQQPPEGEEPGIPLNPVTTDPQDILAGGPVDGIASMAMGYIYPVLKTSFESQIRRATVTVKWREGESEHSFDVTQYLVADQGVALELGDESLDEEPPAGGTTTPGSPATPASGPSGLQGILGFGK